ncbi:MAG: F0F1 ATP synthase subunit gamma [Planctomycetota bacterium]|nr:F0F1 ATP synthase subunit gamma [Planctomycetota bacterium]
MRLFQRKPQQGDAQLHQRRRGHGFQDLLLTARKGADYLRKLQKGRLGERIELLDTRHDLINNIKFPVALDYSRKAMKMHEEKQIDAYYIVFSTFANVLSQHPHVKKIWPADPQDIAEDSDEQFQHDYMYEPPAKELLSPILERFLSMSVFQAMLESASSEFAARMTAMENATRNADELIDDLTLAYNKARQAAITDEMLDIVGGAEAMRSSQ